MTKGGRKALRGDGGGNRAKLADGRERIRREGLLVALLS